MEERRRKFKQDVARSEGEPFRRFMDFIWGGEERMAQLEKLLDSKAINNNMILTRGVCSEVQEALLHTGGNGRQHISSKFSRVLDTQGECAAFRDGEWVSLPRMDQKKFSHRQPALEIAKDVFIVKEVLAGLKSNEETKDHKIVYVDDSPEFQALLEIANTDPHRVVMFPLEKETRGGILSTTPKGKDTLAKLVKFLNEEPANTLHVVWDFDCTLTALHLYKTWNCAKYPGLGMLRFPTWAALLDDFVDNAIEQEGEKTAEQA
jgi:hypothetical protein